jgi:ribosome-binding factor A
LRVSDAHLCASGSFVLKYRNRREREPEFVDPEFAEALTGNSAGRESSKRKVQRKTQQFCRQVQRALNLALADGSADDRGWDLFVEEVSPAPDCGHLAAHVAVPDGCSLAEALTALRREMPRLRQEVAMAIARKRAPELFFVPSIPAVLPTVLGGGGDE